MRKTLKELLKTAEKNRRLRLRGGSVLLILSLIVTLNVFWGMRQTGLTLAGEASCGIEEHTHDEACYASGSELVCDKETEIHEHAEGCYDENGNLVCEATEIAHEHAEGCYDENGNLVCEATEIAHEHTEDCYAKQLVCEKEEHVHEMTCYSDETADTETQLDWQEMFDGMITGDLREDLVKVAQSQIGYTESVLNFEVHQDGERGGYTRYGAWYGAPYSDWSAMFVSFCLNYAGADAESTPYNIGADAMRLQWDAIGRFVSADEDYLPEKGDIIFFDDNTAGIISSANLDLLTVVMGDHDDAVAEITVMAYEDRVEGFGLTVLPQYALMTLEGDASDAAEEAGFTLDACSCGNETAEAGSHADTCAYKSQLKTLAAEYTAQELYEIWEQIPEDAGAYILQYLTDNAWQYGTKAEELQSLIAGGGSGGGGTGEGPTASCGDATFTVQGDLPETAVLHVTDPGYSEEKKKSYVNPNINRFVKWSMLYDISITNAGEPYAPASPVKVTVRLPQLTSEQYDPVNTYFYVSHLDGTTGAEISKERVELIDQTITFTASGFSPYLLYTIDMDSEGGERILGTNWMELRDSGFFTYWEQFLDGSQTLKVSRAAALPLDADGEPSDVQVDKWGGQTENPHNDGVEVSKTIDGTDVENVFDITLTVQTKQSISEIYEEPDMAVVIVMDISQTMNNNFGGTTRYKAAMLAAEDFVDRFAGAAGEVSRLGYVAFNTHGHEIFDLSPCGTTSQAEALKNTMRQATGNIINNYTKDSSGNVDDHNRFTNIEAGLKMGYDMLKDAPNEHKYLIFLSDGFPTTYIKSGYTGWDPYCSSGTKGADGVFYDYVTGYYNVYGTSYSDKAAIRARQQAQKIKADGVTIFSIGVDVGGHTIDGYDGRSGLSVIDRTGTTYELGDAKSTDSYVNWLENSIGSGYYYDSTDTAGLINAYDEIFEEIIRIKEEASKADWVAQDPIPLAPPELLEFIGFYNKDSVLQDTNKNLSGTSGTGKENTAEFELDAATGLHTINWDLKTSGYSETAVGNVTTYKYALTYRVRLKNELEEFVEDQIYDTNAPTSLTYRIFESLNGVPSVSDQRKLSFMIPAVHGYVSELEFTKQDPYGSAVEGAEFALTHDTAACSVCRGDGKNAVAVPKYTASSAKDGKVRFTGIPSGHVYALTETKAPPGYVGDSKAYRVTVAYDQLIMEEGWSGVVINKTAHEFPSTGGGGMLPYMAAGLLLTGVSIVWLCIRRRKRERRREA